MVMASENNIKTKISISLVHCLALYTRLFHEPCDMDTLLADLPIKSDGDSPDLLAGAGLESIFVRAADRAGLHVRLVKRNLKAISPLVLPVILLLKDGRCCILESIDKRKGRAGILAPETGDSLNLIGLQQLEKEYLGFAFFIGKKFSAGDRADEGEEIPSPKHWFWSTLWISKSIYSDVILASLAINIFVVAGPLFTMNVYDRVVPNNAVETLWALAIGVITVYCFDTILKLSRTYFLEVAAKKSDILLSSRIFAHVMGLKMVHKPKTIGSFASNLKEFDSIRNFLTASTLATCIDMPFIILFLAVIWYIGGNLVLIPIVMACLIVLYTVLIKTPLYRSIEQTYNASANKNGILIESLMGMETLKSLGAVGQTQYKWEEATAVIAQKGLKSRILSASISTVTALCVQLNTVFIIIGGVYMIQDIELTLGGLIAVVILSSRTIAPLGQVASLIANYEQTRVAFTTLKEIMTLETERPASRRFIQKKDMQGRIACKDVTFAYPESRGAALERVSFTVEPGERVAILGRIGAGKSTVGKLLMGFFTADSGSILIDNIDINQIDPHWLRKNTGYVPQDILLFKGSLKENIAMGMPHAHDEAVRASAERAGLQNFIDGSHRGFDMHVAEGGTNLSGGQRQGIGLARGFLADSSLVILDEPTASMDTATESEVIDNLKSAVQDKTVILMTHKTSLLALVDRVIVLDGGRLIHDSPKDAFLQQYGIMEAKP